MTTTNHTDISASRARADAATFNAPMGELDAAIGDRSTLPTPGESLVAAILAILAGSLPIADAGVTTAKLADAVITNAKLATDVKAGSLAALTTTDKTSLQAAINEVDANTDAELAARAAGDVALGLRIDPLVTTAVTSGGTAVTQLSRAASAARMLNIGGDGTTTTVNTNGAHSFVDGDYVEISGCVTTPAYNDLVGPINKISTTQFTYASSTNAATETPTAGYARTCRVFVVSTTPFVANQQISITSDAGDLHTTTVVGTPSGGVIQLAASVPITWTSTAKASSGNTVSSTLEEVRLSRGGYTSVMHRLAGIDALPGTARLSTSPAAGATSIALRSAPPTALQNAGWLIIDPFTSECEMRKAGAISGASVAVSALTYAHAADDAVYWAAGKPEFFPEFFGAKGDNSTNDATALQLSIDAATVAGGIVRLTGAGYKSGSALGLKDGVVIEGAAKYATTLTFTGATDGFTNLTGSRIGVGLHRMTIYKAAGLTGGTAIKFLTVDRSHCSELRIKSASGSGSGFGWTVGVKVDSTGQGAYHNIFEDCFVETVGGASSYAYWLTGDATYEGPNSTRIIGGEARSDGSTAVYQETGNNVAYFGLSIEGTTTKGIHVVGTVATAASATIVGCRFEHSGGGTTSVHFGVNSAGCVELGNLFVSGVTTQVLDESDFNLSLTPTAAGGLTLSRGNYILKNGIFSSTPTSGNAALVQFQIQAQGEAFPRFTIKGNNRMSWGPGSADVDVNFVRSGTGVLQLETGTFDMHNAFRINGATGAKLLSGTGSPEGVQTAGVGSLYTRTDGGAGTVLYIKESGSGSSGWVAK